MFDKYLPMLQDLHRRIVLFQKDLDLKIYICFGIKHCWSLSTLCHVLGHMICVWVKKNYSFF